MSQKFYKGRTNNHLTWVMVDATDFATPESNARAATTITIYGKLRGGTGVNTVSTGTGSLTNDITHVGASATGIYTIALAKADLSDASAAWYDQYVVALTAAGCAQQVLVVDGGIDDSAMLLLSDAVSNAYSAAAQANSRVILVQSRLSTFDAATSDALSNIYSGIVALSDLASNAYSAAFQANSRILVVQSHASQIDSVLSSLNSEFLSRVPEEVAARSQVSDLISDLASDLKSFLTGTGVSLTSDTISNLRSAISAGPAATITASDISAIAAAVWDEDYTIAGNNASSSFGSAFRVLASNTSDIDSMLTIMSDILSDTRSVVLQANSRLLVIQSAVSQIDSVVSNINSLAASSVDASDIASAVWAESIGAAVSSRVLQIRNQVSDLQSDFQSRVPKAVATNSQLSDLHSDLRSYLVGISDIASNAYSAAVQASSRALVIQSHASQTDSVLSALNSEFLSRVPKEVAARSQLSDLHSDLKSAVGDVSVALAASDISAIASQVAAGIGFDPSDIASAVWVDTAGAAVSSRVLQIRNQVSDLQSDFQSRVPKLVATSSQVSDLASDLKSLMGDGIISDIYSLLSDLHSDVGVLSDVASNILSQTAIMPTRVLSGAAANPIHANIREVNDVSLVGDGSGTPWGPE